MINEKVEKLQRLTELSEEVCSLPLLAAKMEPIGEMLVQESRPPQYGLPENESEETRAKREAREALAGETGPEMLQVVNELRELAARIEPLVGKARSLAHDRELVGI